jgi:hypothetical protein
MHETLGTTSFGSVEPIQSNLEEFCIHCGVLITSTNDSGWEVFTNTENVTTQKTRKSCDAMHSCGGGKAE